MKMEPGDRQALLAYVAQCVDKYGYKAVMQAIGDAHRARPDGRIVTTENLHLFRQYRNDVSAAPIDLMKEATDG